MSNKLFVHVEPENHFVGHTHPNYVEVARLALEVGRPYLVQAKGLVGPEAGVFMNMLVHEHAPRCPGLLR
jgi:hypothetical protein